MAYFYNGHGWLWRLRGCLAFAPRGCALSLFPDDDPRSHHNFPAHLRPAISCRNPGTGPDGSVVAGGVNRKKLRSVDPPCTSDTANCSLLDWAGVVSVILCFF